MVPEGPTKDIYVAASEVDLSKSLTRYKLYMILPNKLLTPSPSKLAQIIGLIVNFSYIFYIEAISNMRKCSDLKESGVMILETIWSP